MKIKSATNSNNDIVAGVIPVNSFFTHWIKEIDIKRYGDNIPILLLTNSVEIYKYSDETLKHMPKGALGTLYSKQKVQIYKNDNKRYAHCMMTNATAPNRNDLNLTRNEFIYRVPLKFLCDLGLVNQCFKCNTKYILTLETDMQRLFETNINQEADALPGTTDTEIILTYAPFIMYEQLKLDDNYRTYLEGVLISEHVLRTRIKLTPYQKSYEIIAGIQSEDIDF